jgi:hypothetical protein
MAGAIFVRMKRLTIALGLATLMSCTSAEKPEPELPDSAMTEVPADPAAAPQPIQPESVTRAPARSPSTATTSTAQRAPVVPAAPTTQDPPPRRQPPQPHDTRPSIPLPLDTVP